MTPQQLATFAAAAGFQPAQLTFVIRLLVGGLALLAGLLILIGLMRLADSDSALDKSLFFINLFALAFVLMLIFIYIA